MRLDCREDHRRQHYSTTECQAIYVLYWWRSSRKTRPVLRSVCNGSSQLCRKGNGRVLVTLGSSDRDSARVRSWDADFGVQWDIRTCQQPSYIAVEECPGIAKALMPYISDQA